MRHIITLAGLIICLFVLQSCSSDSEFEGGLEDNTNIKIRGNLFQSSPDDRIVSLRIMAFDIGDNIVKSNTYYGSAELSDVITHNMKAGFFNFYIIANEPASVSSALNNIIEESDLSLIHIPESYFSSQQDIPMIFKRLHVNVLPNNAGIIDKGNKYTVWTVLLERLAIRFDILLRASNDLSSYFTGFSFDNIPDFVPITGDYSGTHTTKRTYLLADANNASYFKDTTVAGFAWAKKIQRVILPSHVFSPINQLDRILKFTVLTNTGFNPGCTFGIDEADGNFTIPHNRNLRVTATLKYPLEVHIDARPWGIENVNGNINEFPRELNLSSIKIDVTESEPKKLFFWTPRWDVYIEPVGYMGKSGSTPFNVNDVFQDLAYLKAPNLVYDRISGKGFLNFSYISNSLPSGSTTVRIYINADNLRRELTVTVHAL